MTSRSFPFRSCFRFVCWFAVCCGAVNAFGQAFVAEWSAAASGGVGPTGMALAAEGSTTFLYVADHPRGRILKFNPATGAVVATLGAQGNGSGQFNQPYGIAIEPVTGDLYVAERSNNRVQRITNTGAFVMAWGGPGTAAGQFAEPTGIALDAAGDVYVTEHSNHRVQKFRVAQSGGTWSATHLATWGTQGSGNGQFNVPYSIAIESGGTILVADGLNGRVQRFSSSGVYQATIGATGTGPGQFVVATGVGLDPSGAIFVTSTNTDPQNATAADAASQWVSKFNANGTFVSRWGGAHGGGPGQFKLPFSVVLGPNNRAYVADYYNSRVQVFDLAAPPTTTPPPSSDPAPAVSNFTVGATTATSVTFQLVFNKAVTGVDSSDFATVTTGAATATIGAVTGSGATYSIPVSFTGTGSVQLNLKASGTGIADTAGTALAAGATGPVYTIPATPGADTTPPAVSAFTIASSTAASVTYQLTFSENVTGVNSADFTASTTGGAIATIGPVSGSGAVYTIPVSFTGTGTIQLRLNATGSGIVDVAGNALATGANGPTHTIGGATETRIVSATVPPNGRYERNDTLTFTLRFSGNVFVRGGDDDDSESDNEEDDEAPYFTWTAVAATGQAGADGRAIYHSGSGTATLTFRLKVHNGDVAPAGIRLGTTLQLPSGAELRDARGTLLASAALTIPWTQNPLTGVILEAPRPGVGNNGNGHGRSPEDRLANLSSRLRVTGGDARRSAIAGFVVTGNAPKAILVRAVGPGLAAFGIRDGVAAPRLEVRDSTGRLVAGNDGWGNSAEISAAGDRVGAFRLTHGSRDAALLLSLAPGAYTAQVSANGNGMILLEIYDATERERLATEQIINISTRGFVDTGEGELVAGFVIAGHAPKQVLIRGIGPGLAGFGVTGVVADPVLKLHAAGTAAPIAQNDNWQTPLAAAGSTFTPATAAEITAAATAAGAFPLAASSRDAVLLVTLPPGNYSAVVSGANGGTGAGLVEVYEVPNP